MWYSVQIQAHYRRYVRTFGAHMDIEDFARLYFERAEGSKAKITVRQRPGTAKGVMLVTIER